MCKERRIIDIAETPFLPIIRNMDRVLGEDSVYNLHRLSEQFGPHTWVGELTDHLAGVTNLSPSTLLGDMMQKIFSDYSIRLLLYATPSLTTPNPTDLFFNDAFRVIVDDFSYISHTDDGRWPIALAFLFKPSLETEVEGVDTPLYHLTTSAILDESGLPETIVPTVFMGNPLMTSRKPGVEIVRHFLGPRRIGRNPSEELLYGSSGVQFGVWAATTVSEDLYEMEQRASRIRPDNIVSLAMAVATLHYLYSFPNQLRIIRDRDSLMREWLHDKYSFQETALKKYIQSNLYDSFLYNRKFHEIAETALKQLGITGNWAREIREIVFNSKMHNVFLEDDPFFERLVSDIARVGIEEAPVIKQAAFPLIVEVSKSAATRRFFDFESNIAIGWFRPPSIYHLSHIGVEDIRSIRIPKDQEDIFMSVQWAAKYAQGRRVYEVDEGYMGFYEDKFVPFRLFYTLNEFSTVDRCMRRYPKLSDLAGFWLSVLRRGDGVFFIHSPTRAKYFASVFERLGVEFSERDIALIEQGLVARR